MLEALPTCEEPTVKYFKAQVNLSLAKVLMHLPDSLISLCGSLLSLDSLIR